MNQHGITGILLVRTQSDGGHQVSLEYLLIIAENRPWCDPVDGS